MRVPTLYLSAASAALALSLVAQPALAQEQACTGDDCTQDEAGGDAESAATLAANDAEQGPAILVTGTRIRTPNLDSPVPVTSVAGEEFFESGQVSVGDMLNELPALRSTFSQQNSTRFLGTGGLNLLDLRGLGTNRTLVLMNGRRFVGADVLGDGVSVDVNAIPTDLIERVDIVTGGNSAIYGSDAIAGVVNFVLKDDFEGVQLRGQEGISSRGDANNYYISGLAGTNFADGRGNIAINAEYAHQSDLYAPDRPHTRNLNTYVQVDTDPSSAPDGSDGTPDRLFYEDVRYGYYADGGTYLFFPFDEPYLFQPDGSLVKQTGTPIPGAQDFFGVPLFVGGNGDNFRSGKQSGLLPELDRYSVSVISHFEVSPAFVPFFEGTYTRTESLSNSSGPFFTNATGSPREAFFTTNPYLNSEAADFIRTSYGDYYDANCDYTGGDGMPDSDQCGFAFYRSLTDLGNREEDATRETYRLVGGVRGDISDHWNYEVSVNYGETRNRTKILGNVNLQRYLLAIDAVDEGEFNGGTPNGNIVCRAQLDPSAAVPYEFASDGDFAQQQLAGDVAACQPANFFGEGNLSAAARDYIVQDTSSKGKITQLVLNGFVSGDTSGAFELPGGPVGIALGAEYRRETLYYTQDAFTNAGLTFYNQIPTFDPPSFEVKEAFAELRLPILSGVPGAEELTIGAAGRVADYKGSTGTVFAYNANVQWAPIPDLTLRANYSRAVRAPSLADQYTPLGTNFAQINDPCSESFIGDGAQTRESNCRSDGVPVGYDYQYTSSLQYQSGGNTNLNAETSNSLTIGGILQPGFAPGLSLSVDYFDIQVDDVITTPTAQQIVDSCYDASDLDNQFCGLFERAGAGGGPRGEIQGQILENSLQVVLLNYAKLKARGIDVNAAYDRYIDGLGARLNARVTYTHMLQNDQFLDPTDPDRADQLLLELGYPEDAANASVSLDFGSLTFGYKVRYIGHMVLNEYEDLFSKQGRPPENADYAEDRFYTDVWYHDARIEFDPTDKYSFYVGVDNIFDRLPPQGLTGIGGGSGIYDVLGRYFYAGAVARF